MAEIILTASQREHFLDKISPEPTTGCWLWTARIDRYGYGKFATHIKGTARKAISYPAHRVSYSIFRQALTEGLQIDHLCRVKCCVNPDHLEQVTARENVRRSNNASGLNSRKIQCKRGHSLTDPKNLFNYRGHRACKTCRAENLKAWRTSQPSKGPHNRDKTHCRNGHPLSGDNLRIVQKPSGPERRCRRCHADNEIKRRANRAF